PCRAPARPQPSELPIAVVSLDRIHAADQRRAHLAFGRDDLLGSTDDIFDDRLWNDHHAITITEQIVACADRHLADRYRLAERHRTAVPIRNPSGDHTGRRQERAEDRKALRENEIGVARAAVDDKA